MTLANVAREGVAQFAKPFDCFIRLPADSALRVNGRTGGDFRAYET